MTGNNKKIVGIDLGTTFSLIAHIDEHGKPECILNNENTPTTPSAVYFENESNIVVGQLARDNAIAAPDNVQIHVKRHMGEKIPLPLGTKEYAPEQISAMILERLKRDAEEKLGMPITDAVITVPAYFGAPERKATQDAGEMAGLKVHCILNEPTAAALAFGFANPQEEATVLVYDLGGGTFDITLMKIAPSGDGGIPKVDMISTGGNARLGGVDWDERIMEYVAQQFAEKHGGEDPRDDLASKQDLYSRCEKAKIALARVGTARIACQHKGNSEVVELDRKKLKELTEDLLQTTVTELDLLLNDKGYTPDQIDQVLLVGGSTKLLMVREMLEAKFPGKLNTSVHPDQCVAEGAAWMGHLLLRKPGDGGKPPEPPGGPVASHALGVRAYDEHDALRVFPLIVKDEKLPCDGQDTFYTREHDMRSVEIPIFENEARSKDEIMDPDAGRPIGSVVVEGLPAGRPPGQPIEVTFHFDKSCVLAVKARDVNSGVEKTARIEMASNLDEKTKGATRKMLESAKVEG
jgi:molecular chaperone DnaK